ncbi:MAG: CPBP family intramembrane glutamic endopeptidase [Acidimicrobiales bacterium]
MDESPEPIDRPHTRIPLWVMIVAVLGGFLASNVIALVILAAHHNATSSLNSSTAIGVEEIGLWIFFIGAAGYASHRYLSGRLREDYGLHVRLWPDLPLGLLIGALCQLVIVPLLYLPFELSNPSISKSLSQPAKFLIGSGRNGGELIVAAVVVVGAPIVEELFFRGLVLQSILGRFRDISTRVARATAIVVSAVVFALVHFEPLQFLGLVVVGLILGYAKMRTRRLGLAIFIHAGFNLVAFVALVSTATIR